MIKSKYIHRTITVTTCEILLVNPSTKEVTTCGFTIVGKDIPDKALMEHAKSDSLVPVSIISKTESTHYIRLPESTFFDLGEEVDSPTQED